MWAGTTIIAFSLLICPCSNLYSKKKKRERERKEKKERKKSKLKPTARAVMTAKIKRTKIPCSLADWVFV